jgi:predicted phosphate transport protein (TIGR00153 family)
VLQYTLVRGHNQQEPPREEEALRLKISQRSEVFFDLFDQSASNLRETSELLRDLVENYDDVDLKVRRIQDREHEGDEITHAIIQRLNTSFVTPIDREDIYRLATALDDVLDAIEAVADLLLLHKVIEPLAVMKAQVDVLVQASSQTEGALGLLAKMDRERLEPYWIEINSLENEGDRIYRHAVAELFSGDHKAMDVLRWKEVIEYTEEAIDGLERVSNIIESIVLKHA